jgi:hypothetical protein
MLKLFFYIFKFSKFHKFKYYYKYSIVFFQVENINLSLYFLNFNNKINIL